MNVPVVFLALAVAIATAAPATLRQRRSAPGYGLGHGYGKAERQGVLQTHHEDFRDRKVQLADYGPHDYAEEYIHDQEANALDRLHRFYDAYYYRGPHAPSYHGYEHHH